MNHEPVLIAPLVNQGVRQSVSAPLTFAVAAFDPGQLLVSTPGNDTLTGTSPNATVTYASATAPVTVSLAITTQQNTGGAGLDTLTNIDNLIGSDHNDNLTGNSQNNGLDGGAGTDILVGGSGDDEYIVDRTSDIVTEKFNGGNGGTDVVNSSATYKLSANVENLTLMGTLAINGTGNKSANLITGNEAINTLNGGVGADTLLGGLGNDTYIIDNVNDIVIEQFGEGTDRVNSKASYTLSANVEHLTLTGTSVIDGTGNDLGNRIVGNTADNQLDGKAGNDILDGRAGNNILTGGTGKDYFRFKTIDHLTEGRIDTITDFNVADDVIKLENNIFTAFATAAVPIKIADGEFVIGTHALDADDFIIYNSGTGALLYDADGNGADAAVQFATITGGLAMTSKDFHVE